MIYFRLFVQAPAQLAWYAAKSKPLPIICALLLLVSFCTNLDSGYYMGKWIPIAALATLLAAAKLYEFYGAALACNFLYCIGSTIWVACYSNRYASVQPYDLQGIKMFSIEAGWKLALGALPLLYLTSSPRIRIPALRAAGRLACTAFLTISAAKVGWEWAHTGCAEVNACGGSLMNPSLNAAMMAVVLPLVPFPLYFAAVAALCAFAGKTSIGAGMVALFLFGHGIRKLLHYGTPNRWFWGGMLAGILPFAVLVLGFYTHQGKAFFDSSGRFQMWRFFMGLWAINWKNWLTGTGFGTFGVFSINLQHAFAMNQTDWWIWPHNDWLEQIFVGGAVGGLLLIWLYLWALGSLLVRGFYEELSALLLFGVGMGVEYFLHIGPCCAFALWILTIALFTPQNDPTGEMQ